MSTHDSGPGAADQRSLGEVVSDLSTDLSTLMKQEVALAKAELKDEVTKVGKGAGMLGGAGFAGWFVLLFLSLALMFLLDNWLPVEAAALITTGRVGGHRRRPGRHRPQGAAGSQPAAAADPADPEGGRAMGQSTEELTSQIEDTRQRMASDLDTLQDRVSPSAIVERRKQAVRGGLSAVKDKVMGSGQSAGDSVSSAASSAQERFEGAPLAAGVVAFGAGVVLASLLPASRMEAEAAHRVVDTAKEQGGPVLDDVRAAGAEVVESVKQQSAEAARHVKDSAQESVETVKDEGQASAGSVTDEASDPYL